MTSTAFAPDPAVTMQPTPANRADSPRMNTRVFICSPYRPVLTAEERNILSAAELMELRDQRQMDNLITVLTACAFAVAQGKLPMAPHAYFTRFLDDDNLEERAEGIRLGKDWLLDSEELWVMGETISAGMKNEIKLARQVGIPIWYFIPVNITPEANAASYYLPVGEPKGSQA